MKKIINLKIVLTLITISLFLTFGLSASAIDQNLVMGSSVEGTWAFRVATGMARLIDRQAEGINLSVQPGWTTTAGIYAYDRNEVQITYTNVGALVDAWNNRGIFKDGPVSYKPYQGIWFMSSAHTLAVEKDNEDINSWSDIAGKGVFPCAAGTGSYTLAQDIFGRLGLWTGGENEADIKQVGYPEVADAFRQGVIDATLIYIMSGETLPSGYADLESRMDIKIINPSEEEKLIISEMPGYVPGYMIDPKKVFRGDVGVDEIWGIALLFGWHFGPAEDTETVYKITKTWYENADELLAIDAGFLEFKNNGFGLNASVYNAYPDIPVHPGVAKYLK